jgi:hypothetical protein
MKTNHTRTLVLAALALFAAGAVVNPAAAQSSTACKGSFTLAKETRWQGRVLPAGNYTFSLKSAAMPALLELRGPNGAQILVSRSQSRRHEEQPSFMSIEWRHGAGYVRELYLAPIGVHFFYVIPKAPKEELLAQSLPNTERVLISTAGN